MAGKRYSATLHRRGGITMAVEVPEPVPEAVVRLTEITDLDQGRQGGEAGNREFGERLFRRRSSDDPTIHYIQDHYLPEPSEGGETMDRPPSCTKCGRVSAMYFVQQLGRTEVLSATSNRLCADCYPG
jgi:hypothetical protein